MSKVANKLRSHIRINNEWGRVVEGQTDDMALAADLLDEAEKALAGVAPLADIFDESAGNRPKTGEICSWVDHRVGERVLTVEALRLARATLARIRGEKT